VLPRGETAVPDIYDPEKVDAETKRGIDEQEEPQEESGTARTAAKNVKDRGDEYRQAAPGSWLVFGRIAAHLVALHDDRCRGLQELVELVTKTCFLLIGAVLSVLAVTPAFAADPKLDATALLNGWVAAQNAGNFEAYQSFYAPNFTGVRRSGSRTASFDRAGWMQDRRRMFQKKMTVSAENVRVFADMASARVIFVQRWASGRYSDVGAKELVLQRGAAGFRIAREELLASAVGKPGNLDVEAFRRFAFVVDGEVVISLNPEDRWASGPPVFEKPGADRLVVRTRRSVDLARLPRAVARLAGMPIRLLDASGERCEAKLGAFLLRGRAISDVANDEGDTWGISAHLLVAKVDGDRQACAGATWARASELPVPTVTPAEAPSTQVREVALVAFSALPQSARIQKQFDEWYRGAHADAGKSPRWFAHESPGAEVRVLRSGPKSPTLVSVSASIEESACGEGGVSGELWALWELQGDVANPRVVLRNKPDDQMTLVPTATVDVDGDGRVELLFDDSSDFEAVNASGQPDFVDRGIVRALGGLYIDVSGPITPILVCPC